MNTEDALRLAKERGFDLIEVAAKTEPPVVRLGDYHKYLYQQAKLERKARAKKSEVKNIQIRPGTSKHDLEIKAAQIEKFLTEGHKVTIEMRLRGRQKALRNFAKNKFNEFLAMLKNCQPEGEIKTPPNGFNVTIVKSK